MQIAVLLKGGALQVRVLPELELTTSLSRGRQFFDFLRLTCFRHGPPPSPNSFFALLYLLSLFLILLPCPLPLLPTPQRWILPLTIR